MKAQGECTVDIVKVLILNMSGSCEFIRALKFNIISVCDINICVLDPLWKTTTSEIPFALIIQEFCKKIASQEITFQLKFTLFGSFHYFLDILTCSCLLFRALLLELIPIISFQMYTLSLNILKRKINFYVIIVLPW